MPCFIPLSELPTELGGQPNIAWNIDPGGYVDSEQLVFNTWAARTVMRLAGFNGMRFGTYQGEQDTTTTVSHTITDINPDGSATGAATIAVVKAEVQRGSLEKGESGECPQIHWPVADIEVNSPALAQRRSKDVTERGSSREEAFARNISTAIARGVIARARENLITDPLKSKEVRGLGSSFALTAIFLAALDALNGMAVTYPIHQLVSAGSGLVARSQYPNETTKLRFSLLPYGFQPDRLALAALVARAFPLVRTK